MSPPAPDPAASVRRRFRCAELSERLAEPLTGTASTATDWLLVEQPGPWGYDALERNRMARDALVRLRRVAREAGLRPVLIRRPDRHDLRERRLFVARSADGAGSLRSWAAPTVEHALDADMATAGEAETAPLLLVCTNGRRDPCCAERGRSAFQAIARVGGDRVWECSHIGGDRFAANVVVMPAGVYYGRVTPGDAPRLVEASVRGRILLDRYRGRTRHPMPVQFAEAYIRRQLDIAELDGLELAWAQADDGEPIDVRFRIADGEEAAVMVTVEAGAPRRLTCHSTRERPPLVYDVTA